MIEIVYKEEDSEVDKNISIKTPKNIRQIGDGESTRKIYVEDYAMSYIKQVSNRDMEDVQYGVLLGNIKRGGGNVYIFVSAVMEIEDHPERSITFHDYTWTSIYDTMKRYFNDTEIVGWFVSEPYSAKDEFVNIQKIHLDQFAGNDKVCFYYDKTENEDAFYLYDNGSLRKQQSYYIYYERNEEMQNYMVERQKGNKVDPEVNDRVVGSFRTLMQDKKKKPGGQKVMSMAYTASTFLIVVVLVAIIVLMNNYGELKNMQQALNEMAQGNGQDDNDDLGDAVDVANEPQETVTVENVQGNVKPSETTQQPTTQQPTTPVDTATQAPASVGPEKQYYTVQSGETLYDISRKIYNNITMVESIKQANGLTDADLIYEGQKLVLP